MKPFSLVMCINADDVNYPYNGKTTGLFNGKLYMVIREILVGGEIQLVLTNTYAYYGRRFKEYPLHNFLDRVIK